MLMETPSNVGPTHSHVSRAGLVHPPGPARTGSRCCRHRLLLGVYPLQRVGQAVQHLIGHSPSNVTLNPYAHLWPDSDDRARQAVDAALSGVPPVCPYAEEG
jgi:hypothetical protein